MLRKTAERLQYASDRLYVLQKVWIMLEIFTIFIDKNMKAEWKYSDEMCGYLLRVKAYKKQTDNNLYSKYSENFEDYTLNMIPYASFANRGESNMLVWFNIK